VNNRGHALGNAVVAGGASATLYFYDGSVRSLGLYQGTLAAGPDQMNDNDVVVGHTTVKDASGQYHSWTWTPTGGYADLARYNGQQTNPTSINNGGVIVGSALNATTNRSQAVVWSSPTSDPVAVPGTPDGSFATSVNNLGQIVGQIDGPNGTRRGFLPLADRPGDVSPAGDQRPGRGPGDGRAGGQPGDRGLGERRDDAAPPAPEPGAAGVVRRLRSRSVRRVGDLGHGVEQPEPGRHADHQHEPGPL
jgi:hypothetical protein